MTAPVMALGVGLLIIGAQGSIVLPGAPQTAPTQGVDTVTQKPAWVVDGVADTVWILAELAAESPDDEAKELLIEAELHARLAAEEDSAHVGRRFALAVVLGLRTDREGGRTKIRVASELHSQLMAILEFDPEHAFARHLLGRLHAGVRRMGRVTRWLATNVLGGGELKKATWELAEQNLAFAEEHEPDVPAHHLQLANLYRDTDRKEQAFVEIEHTLALTARSPMERATQLEATELKARLGR